MKKLISLALALMLLVSILAVPAMAEEPAKTEEPRIRKVGVLSMLNIDEAKMQDFLSARRFVKIMKRGPRSSETPAAEGTNPDQKPADGERPAREGRTPSTYEVIYYDSLNAMQMALTAGEINRMEIYETTAKYLCANNEALTVLHRNRSGEVVDTAEPPMNDLLYNDFAFMLLEGREALRDEFNTAIAAIKEDGTMAKLTAEYIDGVIEGKAIAPIEIAKIDGAETIKVAITGCLPPMDYIAPDGTPAGFNTALLAEISKRIGKNIELVQVDSIGRAPALASGTVDVVFWTRVSEAAAEASSLSEAEQQEAVQKFEAGLTERELRFVKRIMELVKPEEYSKADMPGGTIVTNSYFSDKVVNVMLKSEAEAMRAAREAQKKE